jgi:hypothetical protein
MRAGEKVPASQDEAMMDRALTVTAGSQGRAPRGKLLCPKLSDQKGAQF